MKNEMVYVNDRGRKVAITVFTCKVATDYIVNIDFYNHKIFKTLKGAQRYLERNGFTKAE